MTTPSLSPARPSRLSTLALVVWIGIVVLALVVFVVGIGALFANLQQVCLDSAQVCQSLNQLTPAQLSNLIAMGSSAQAYAWYVLVTRAAAKALGVVVGGLVFWRLRANPMAWVASLLLIIGAGTEVGETLTALQPAWWLPTHLLGFIAAAAFGLFFYMFPNGRFVPGWTRWLAPLWVIIAAGFTFFPGSAVDLNQFPPPLILIFGSFAVAPALRYRHFSTTVERQQTKWVVLAIAAGLSGFAVALSVVLFGDNNPPKLTPLFFVIDFGFNALTYLLPIGIAIAILRYRLWDIDVIIRRTVTYAIISAALAIVYLGANVAAQSVIGALGGQRNELAIVASTLAVAALFSPVRRRVQNAIDRRFNRQSYDADKVVADFADFAARETDLAALQARIVGIVAGTIQPQQVTMWVRAEHRAAENAPHGREKNDG